jgi:integrase
METPVTEKPKQKRRTARRGNGEGSIYQRSDGRWAAEITVGYGDNGKRRRKTVYGWTKAEVQKKLGNLLPQAQAGAFAVADMTVGAFLDHWLENTVKPNNRATTFESYERIARKHIRPFIGGIRLSNLAPINVESMYTALRNAGRSPRLVQMAHAVLHRACERALKMRHIVANPCNAVERPQAPEFEIAPLHPEQALAFITAIGENRMRALYILAIASGLRWGELNALKWEDVDFEQGAISVRRTLIEIDGRFTINEPKTKKGKRRVELSPIAIEALIDHRARMLREGHAASEWVFMNKDGRHHRRTVNRRSLRRILKSAGLPMIRFHDLRHTCASLLMLKGIHAKVVQERLGHSTVNLTLNTYSHVLPTMQRAAADSLEACLRPTGS